LLLMCACASAGCPRRAEPPPKKATESPLCRAITTAPLPAGSPNGTWGVTLDVEGPVLAAHEARFGRKKILPNGQAWSDVLEQCLRRWDPGALHGVELDPEAGSLHAWVASEQDKDRWVAALCRAVGDAAWLDRCLASVDRSQVDD
ncbi:MAG: hypothetical protein ACXVDD_30040, partial [Polyangia bacterium]